MVDDQDSPQFMVSVNTVLYHFNNFLLAFDTLIKLFFVLNISYPFQNSTFFNFIQDFFYNIESTTDFSNFKTLFNSKSLN